MDLRRPAPRFSALPILTASALAFSLTTFAEVPEAAAKPVGLDVGLRLGYAVPMGDAAYPQTSLGGIITLSQLVTMGEVVTGMVPIQLDVGYWVHRNILVGGYFQAAPALLSANQQNTCSNLRQQDASVACSLADYRLGIQGQYHFLPAERFDPWVGLGLGFEWLTGTFSDSDGYQTTAYNGFEFIHLQGGLDLLAVPGLRLGPFLGLSIAQYGSISSVTKTQNQLTTSERALSSAEVRLHEWFMFGIKGAYTL
jgi:hypothetical protein